MVEIKSSSKGTCASMVCVELEGERALKAAVALVSLKYLMTIHPALAKLVVGTANEDC